MMPETQHSQENLAYVRTHVENIEQMQRFSIASNPNCRAFVERYLDEKKNAPQVYLALTDGPKSQAELQKITGQSQANISKICNHLHEPGIIDRVPDPSGGGTFRYAWTELETLLQVSRIAKQLVIG